MQFDPVLVHEWLRKAAQQHPGKTAVVCGTTRITYAALDACSDRLAATLMKQGFRRHDRAVIFLDNSIETVISLYGTLKAGGAFIILNSSVKGSKLRYVLANSGAGVLIAHTSKEQAVTEALEGYDPEPHILWVDEDDRPVGSNSTSSTRWSELGMEVACEDRASNQTMPGFPRGIDIDLATLIYTSGSTGEPKGVMSTHHNMVSAARSVIQYLDNEESDIVLDVLPLSFDYGLYQVIMTVMFGGTMVLEKSFGFLHHVLQRVVEEQITGLPVVPTMVAMLLRMDDLSKYDLSSLRYITNTAAALPAQHIKQLRELFPGVRIFSMYGLTECKRVSYLAPGELDQRPDSVGTAMPNCETVILDEQGHACRPGEIGELIIRGANVMQGYWQDPVKTARTYGNGPYPAARELRSGDLFRMDDEGFLYFVGRRDDMLKSQGERISPKEIETTICDLTAVAEAAVVGVPDEILGQAIKAVVVPKAGSSLEERDVLRHCRTRLEGFMIPKIVEIVADLPRTPNGKIDRKALTAKG